MRRKERNKAHNQYTQQDYKCEICGMYISVNNALKKANPLMMQCIVTNADNTYCEGHLEKVGKPRQISHSYIPKNGDYFFRYMTVEEETEVLSVKIRVNQSKVSDEDRADEENIKGFARIQAQENIDAGNRGIALDQLTIMN